MIFLRKNLFWRFDIAAESCQKGTIQCIPGKIKKIASVCLLYLTVIWYLITRHGKLKGACTIVCTHQIITLTKFSCNYLFNIFILHQKNKLHIDRNLSFCLFNCASPQLTLGMYSVDVFRIAGWMQKNWWYWKPLLANFLKTNNSIILF